MQVRKRVSNPTLTLLWTFILGASIGLSLGYALFGESGRDTRPVDPPIEKKPAEMATPVPAPTVPTPETPPVTPAPEPKPVVAEPAPVPPPPAETPKPEVQEVPMTFSPGAHLFLALGEAGLDEATCALLQEVQPSGIILRGEVLADTTKTLELVARLHKAMGQPIAMDAWPLVAAEQEGGELNPFNLPTAPGAAELGAALSNEFSQTAVPSPEEIKASASLKQIHTVAKSYAEAAVERGIGVLLAPVINIKEEEATDPALAARLFGVSQALVAHLGVEFVQGISEVNAVAVARTYPGIGRANKKNPQALRTMKYYLNEEDNRTRLAEIVFPFQEAAAQKVPGILVGHVAVPGIDVDQPKRSAAFSPPLIKSVLRELWQYDGVVLADDVTSGPISKITPAKEGVVKALAAGCDAVLFLDPDPDRVRAAVKAIQNAVDTNKLDKEALIKSRERLNGWRKQLAKTNVKFPDLNGPPPPTPPAPEKKTDTPVPVTPAAEPKPVETPAPATPVAETKAVTPTPAPETKPAETPVTPTPEKKAETPAPATPVVETKAATPTPAPETKPAETPAPPAPEKKAETPAPATPAAETKAATPTPAAEPKPAETPAPPAPEKKTETPDPATPAPETKPVEIPVTPTAEKKTEVPASTLPNGERPPDTRRITYTVKENDTLATVAAKYNVAESDILTWSKRTAEEIKPGKKLTIYVKKKAEDTKTPDATKEKDPASTEVKDRPKKNPPDPATLPPNTEFYSITDGDKLAKIAISRNTTVKNLLELNKLESADKIKIGQWLIVPKTQP